ncbi:TerB family tellurite resistance protein [Chitinophaga sp. Hz27]|uniref:TerB family tellurite resistance protein n=1 Tax=Chitinophaga silvatica TaxID=2282649 RepID=A0A3E1YHF1_9BACT|nr:TerB family tellurite resistance protein [Chitinophaga silvatica]RFS26796.1 TerB family tellurite resistance protein [Chitinophaga silvatica]
MKTFFVTMIFLLLMLHVTIPVRAQADELAQLALNIQKLSQLKSILQNMYQGYEIVSKGYNTIKSLSEGNFNLHETFLNGLMAVNPAIKNYKHVQDIIRIQTAILKEYKDAYSGFRSSSLFSLEELEYMSGVYGKLTNESLKNLDELLMAITASKLRMSDDERLASIDRIYADIEDKYLFLQEFNSGAKLLGQQRAKERNDVGLIRMLYGIGN